MSIDVLARDGARVVTVNRPDRRNALDPDTLRELGDVARAMRRDATVRGVVLTGAPGVGVFLSGGDLRALQSVRTARAARDMARAAHGAVDALHALGVPLIAAVGGDAFGGGCELAAACDLRIAEEGVRFHWVQVRFAVTTGWGGASNLLDLVPRGTVTRWLLRGIPVTCDDALTAGFVDQVVPAGQSVEEAVAFIADVSRAPKLATRRMLNLVRASGRLDRPRARDLELQEFGKSWSTRDHHDAVAAFVAAREAKKGQ